LNCRREPYGLALNSTGTTATAAAAAAAAATTTICSSIIVTIIDGSGACFAFHARLSPSLWTTMMVIRRHRIHIFIGPFCAS